MKKNLILLGAVIATCNGAALSLRQPTADAIRVLPKPGELDPAVNEGVELVIPQKTAQQAFDNVLPKLKEYSSQASMAEKENFLKYLDFYRSWYQSVTPAPVEITNKLTANDRAAEYAIKYEAQDFIQPAQNSGIPRMGASSLSKAGDDYYLMIKNYFKAPSAPQKKPMPYPTKPKQQIKPARPFINL